MITCMCEPRSLTATGNSVLYIILSEPYQSKAAYSLRRMSNLSGSEYNNSSVDEDHLQHQTFWFWIDLFTRDFVTGLGIVGNILISVILAQRHMCNTFNKLLVSLAVTDTVMLISCMVPSALRSSNDILGALYPHFLWPRF